jgi:hypothetical protein
MKGSITFRFGGDSSNDYCVRVTKQGELDSGDLEVIAALLHDDIMERRAIEAGQITGQLRDAWTN